MRRWIARLHTAGQNRQIRLETGRDRVWTQADALHPTAQKTDRANEPKKKAKAHEGDNGARSQPRSRPQHLASDPSYRPSKAPVVREAPPACAFRGAVRDSLWQTYGASLSRSISPDDFERLQSQWTAKEACKVRLPSSSVPPKERPRKRLEMDIDEHTQLSDAFHHYCLRESSMSRGRKQTLLHEQKRASWAERRWVWKRSRGRSNLPTLPDPCYTVSSLGCGV